MSGRVALVTGGSRGIGRAIAVALGESGHRVAFCYSSDSDGADTTAKGLRDAGAEVIALRTDVGDPESVSTAFATIEDSFGPVEVLVNNAGINRDGLVARMSDDAWRSVMRVDLDGAFHTIRRAVPKMMRARFGRIVNVSSVVGHMGGPGQANYAAAKAGLLGLSRSVARELASRAITCNVVAPGPIVTTMTDKLTDEWRDRVAATVPLGRMGTPQECAAVVTFLCSDAASYVTGALMPVDGGLAMGT